MTYSSHPLDGVSGRGCVVAKKRNFEWAVGEYYTLDLLFFFFEQCFVVVQYYELNHWTAYTPCSLMTSPLCFCSGSF